MGLFIQLFVVSAFVALLQAVPLEETSTKTNYNKANERVPVPATVAHQHSSSEESDSSEGSKRPARDTQTHKDHPAVSANGPIHKGSQIQTLPAKIEKAPTKDRHVRDTQTNNKNHPTVGGPDSVHKGPQIQTLPAKIAKEPTKDRNVRDTNNPNHQQKSGPKIQTLPAKIDQQHQPNRKVREAQNTRDRPRVGGQGSTLQTQGHYQNARPLPAQLSPAQQQPQSGQTLNVRRARDTARGQKRPLPIRI